MVGTDTFPVLAVKVAAVTGADSGIGRAVAIAYARKGRISFSPA